MDISASQYNSASESGWTHYLDQSSFSENYFQRRRGVGGNIVEYEEGKGARIDYEEEEECEEDLSMVSDASSGPPHYDDAPWYCENYWYSKESQKKKKMVKEYGRSQQQQQHSHLDDTASSPVFNFPKESHKNKVSFSGNGAVEDALDFSQCLSVTRIQRKQKIQKHFRGKQSSEEPGGFDE